MRSGPQWVLTLALAACVSTVRAAPLAVVGVAAPNGFPTPPPVVVTPAVVDLTLGAPIRAVQKLPFCAPSPECVAVGSTQWNPGMFAPDLDGRRVYQIKRASGANAVNEVVEIDVPSRMYGRRLSLDGLNAAFISNHPLQPLLVAIGMRPTGRTVVFIDTATWKDVGSATVPAADAGDVGYTVPVFSPEGAEMFTASPTRIHKLDARDGHVIASRPVDFQAATLKYDPWRSWIWTIDYDRSRVLAFSAETLALVAEFARPGVLMDMAIVSAGDIVLGWMPDDEGMPRQLIEWMDETGGTRLSLPYDYSGTILFYPGGPSSYLYRRIGGGFVEHEARDFGTRQQWTTGADLTTTIAFLPEPTTAVEYYHAALDHYFLTADADEIDALDRGAFAGWQRTGESFRVMRSDAATSGADIPVCRFYGLPSHGLDSHFYTASRSECVAVEHGYDGAWFKERDDAFYVVRAYETTGACPEGTSPVYRLWNARFDSNHRYTTSMAIKAQMIARGYVPEGSGPDDVAFCVRNPSG